MYFPFFFDSLVYIVPFLVFGFFSGRKGGENFNHIKPIYLGSLFVFWFIYCCGYMTGSDTISYENIYENSGGYFDVYDKEVGFYVYVCLFRFFGIGYFPFLIFTKTLCLASFFLFAKRNSNWPIGALFFTLALQGAFLFVNCPLRALVAISIIIFFYQENHLYRTILGIIFASLFHYSAILILLCVVPLFKINVPRWLLGIIYVVCLGAAIFPSFFISLLQTVGLGEYFTRKIEGYAISDLEVSLMRPGVFFNLVVFFILYTHYGLFKPSERKVWAFSILYLAFYWTSLTMPILGRYMLYFVPFLGVALVKIGEETPLCSRKILHRGLQVACLVILLVTVNMFWAYVPYSNYWIHLVSGDLKSFEYRRAHNKDHWGISE